jgi:hypothetical protein
VYAGTKQRQRYCSSSLGDRTEWTICMTLWPLYIWGTPGAHCTGGWWTGTEDLVPISILSPVCPFLSKSLYQLCYAVHQNMHVVHHSNYIQHSWCDSHCDALPTIMHARPSDIKEYITNPELKYAFVTKLENCCVWNDTLFRHPCNCICPLSNICSQLYPIHLLHTNNTKSQECNSPLHIPYCASGLPRATHTHTSDFME